MIRTAALCLAILASGPAHALSCVAPSIADAYESARVSPADYVIARGFLDPLGGPDPAPRGSEDPNNRQPFNVAAEFSGAFFTGSGFGEQRQAFVTIEVGCISAWCGSYGTVSDGLFFFRRDASGNYALESGACPRFVFPNPTRADLQQVVTCHQNGGC